MVECCTVDCTRRLHRQGVRIVKRVAIAAVVVLVIMVTAGAAEAKWAEVRKPKEPPSDVLTRGNLDCSGAIPMAVGQTIWASNIGGDTNVDGYPDCVGWSEEGGEVVFELTIDGPSCVDIGISLWYRPDLYDLDWFLLASCNEDAGDEDNCIEYDDYGWPVDCIEPGTYYLVVDGADGDECEFVVSVYRNEPVAECGPLLSTCHMWDFNTSAEGFVHEECGVTSPTWAWGAAPPGVPETACGDTEVTNVLCTGLSGAYPNNAADAVWVGPTLLGEDCTCLEVCHFYVVEDGYDGGMVGLTTDGGTTWSLLTPARGYDEIGDWENSCVGPFPRFTGEDATEFRTDSFDLTPWIGEVVSIGFFFGSDNSVQELGWYILWAAIGSSGTPVENTSWGAIKALYR
jgi:hypothetical protein